MSNLSRSKRNNIIILCLCAVVLLMGIGYAAFSSVLKITGTSNITSNFRVLITNIETGNKIGDASNKEDPTYTDNSATFSANLEKPGDSITYNITVENQGTIDAVIDSIKINAPKQDAVVFSIEGINSKEDLLKDESKTFSVIVKYNENITTQPDNTSIDFTVDLEYLQKGNSTNFSEADTDETETGFRISDIALDPKETSIGVNLTADGAVKYYYSLDNDKWYETEENNYTLYNLKPYTDYTVYVKAENAEGEVIYGSMITKTDDTTKPVVKLSVGDNVKGNNDWYKGLTINADITDNDQIKESLYCTTTESTCTPNKELEIMDNKASVQFESNASSQKVCIEATDRKGNKTTECSEAYKVDGESPKISNMTLTPDDDTMTIQLQATDAESGVVKYYYSKDSGETYIDSTNSNYTFTSLEEKDYLVSAYAEDEAGNKSEIQAKTTTIRYAAFCEHNDINNLGDCIIATEAGKETDIALAKQTIEAKGTPDFNEISPSIVYGENITSSTSTYSTTYSTMYIGTGYTFNQTTGLYNLTGTSGLQNPTTIDYSNGNHYMCYGGQKTSGCSTIYRITNVSTSTNSGTGQVTYIFTKYDYTQKPLSYDTSGVGMYADSDNEGTTYYYRGSVSGNYVKFADKYWRIIRVNGDGTVRMIYDGTTPHVNGESSSNRQVTTKAFNSYESDNAYVGYMYGDVNNFVETDSGEATLIYSILSSSAKYYFGTSYTLDPATRSFKLSGDLHSGTVSKSEEGYYTCFSTSSTASCQRLFYTTKYNSSTAMTVKVKGYGSTSLEGAHSNITDSTMKDYLDSWYQSNLSVANINDKISKDATFCNNRTRSTYNNGNYNNLGYGINPTMYGYERFWSWDGVAKGPTLACNIEDNFSVTSTNGNGDLDYPIGLITADEVNMAGGISGSSNMIYYLYSGVDYWTMSPASLNGWFYSHGIIINSNGIISGDPSVSHEKGVRPVINLDTSNITFTGSGTMEDPYVIE